MKQDFKSKPKDGWYKVRIWEDMENEFGLYSKNIIITVISTNTALYFTSKNEACLPENRVIYISNWKKQKGIWTARGRCDKVDIFCDYTIIENSVIDILKTIKEKMDVE